MTIIFVLVLVMLLGASMMEAATNSISSSPSSRLSTIVNSALSSTLPSTSPSTSGTSTLPSPTPPLWANNTKCTPLPIFISQNEVTYYEILVPKAFPGDVTEEDNYCNAIKLELLINGQISRTDLFSCSQSGNSTIATFLTIVDDRSCASWVGKWLQAAFPELAIPVSVCGSSFPSDVTRGLCTLQAVGTETVTKVTIEAPFDGFLAARARAQLMMEFPDDSATFTDMSPPGLEFTDTTDKIVLEFATANVENFTLHSEKLERAWPGLSFDCIESDEVQR